MIDIKKNNRFAILGTPKLLVQKIEKSNISDKYVTKLLLERLGLECKESPLITDFDWCVRKDKSKSGLPGSQNVSYKKRKYGVPIYMFSEVIDQLVRDRKPQSLEEPTKLVQSNDIDSRILGFSLLINLATPSTIENVDLAHLFGNIVFLPYSSFGFQKYTKIATLLYRCQIAINLADDSRHNISRPFLNVKF